jgi:hypothetical protein
MEGDPRPLRARRWRAVVRDPRTVAGIAAAVLVLGFATLAVISGAPDVRGIVGISPTPTGSASIAEPSSRPTVALPASFSPLPEQTPVPPDKTPEGVDRVAETSAPISPPPLTSPTPTPDPLVWRFEGIVVDTDGKPIDNVCVIIGPRGCQRGSIRTKDGGRYYIDMPQNATIVYDLFFALEGYEVVWHRAQPRGPTMFNVILRRL